jgi:hypothetical protein
VGGGDDPVVGDEGAAASVGVEDCTEGNYEWVLAGGCGGAPDYAPAVQGVHIEGASCERFLNAIYEQLVLEVT